MNNQPISGPDFSSSNILSVIKIFSTIQGEGPFAGRPAIFVRLFGCNLQCPLCDTDYSSRCAQMDTEDILARVKGLLRIEGRPDTVRPDLVVITGGEPFRQNITPLCKKLLDHGLDVQVETNGTLPPSPMLPSYVVVVCSPKTAKLHPAMVRRINHYKYVLSADDVNPTDGLPVTALNHPATPHIARPPFVFSGTVYLQPVDTGDVTSNKAHTDSVVRSCLRFGYTMCLQLHKIVNLE